jgi:hypothetical protein
MKQTIRRRLTRSGDAILDFGFEVFNFLMGAVRAGTVVFCWLQMCLLDARNGVPGSACEGTMGYE